MKNTKLEILEFISKNPKNLTLETLYNTFKEVPENDIFDYLIEFRDEQLLKGFSLIEFDQCPGIANFYNPKLTEKGKIILAAYIQENSELNKAKRKITLSYKVISYVVGIVIGIVTFLANYTTTIDNAILGFKKLLESIKELF